MHDAVAMDTFRHAEIGDFWSGLKRSVGRNPRRPARFVGTLRGALRRWNQQNVGWLEVAMHDALGMSCLDRSRKHGHKLRRRPRWPGSAIQMLRQIAAGDILEHEVRPALHLA